MYILFLIIVIILTVTLILITKITYIEPLHKIDPLIISFHPQIPRYRSLYPNTRIKIHIFILSSQNVVIGKHSQCTRHHCWPRILLIQTRLRFNLKTAMNRRPI